MELGTVQNYTRTSVNLDGLRSEVIKKAVAADIVSEVQPAHQNHKRISPWPDPPAAQPKFPRPWKVTPNIVAGLKGGIAAEAPVVAQYTKTTELCDGVDYVTQGMIIGILGGEEDHRREFLGFLKEYGKN
jgi:bacterioferritin